MHGAAERVHDRADVLEGIVGMLPGAARRHGRVLGEAAGHVAPDDAQVLADMALVVAALAADAAENVRFHRDEIALVEALRLRADLHYLAAELAAEDERQRRGGRADPGGVVDGQVAWANGGGRDADEELVFGDLGHGCVPVAGAPRAGGLYDGFHCLRLLENVLR